MLKLGENRPGAPRADTTSTPQRDWRRRGQPRAPRSDLLPARVPQRSGARGQQCLSATPFLRLSLALAPGVAAPAGGASERSEPPRGGDEVTALRPSHLPLLSRDAPPGKGRGKVTGAHGAQGGTQHPPRTALPSHPLQNRSPSRPRPLSLLQIPLPEAGSRQTPAYWTQPAWGRIQPHLCDLGGVAALRWRSAPYPSKPDTIS